MALPNTNIRGRSFDDQNDKRGGEGKINPTMAGNNDDFDQLTPREAAKRMKEVIYPDFDAIDMGEGWTFDRPVKPRRKRTFRDELMLTTVGNCV
jgi:hypothetical protein